MSPTPSEIQEIIDAAWKKWPDSKRIIVSVTHWKESEEVMWVLTVVHSGGWFDKAAPTLAALLEEIKNGK